MPENGRRGGSPYRNRPARRPAEGTNAVIVALARLPNRDRARLLARLDELAALDRLMRTPGTISMGAGQ